MSDRMMFPDTVEEFMDTYKVVDRDGYYMSKGAELVPVFRMKQWFEHLLPVPNWIPVRERLPEEEGCYMVTVKNDHKRIYSKTAWYTGDGWFARQDIIAWCPLPEPYVEEKE